MDITPLPAKRLMRPFLLNFLILAALASLCIAIGFLIQSMSSREQALLDQSRTELSNLIGHQGTGNDSTHLVLPMHQLDPSGKFGRPFRIFSQTPLNPANLPNDSERQALLLFQKGASEFSSRSIQSGSSQFMYAQPLTVEASCLRCHADQGYVEGEQRGAIATSHDITASERLNGLQFFLLVVLAMAAVALAFIAPILIRRHFIRTVEHMETRLAEMAATDELTGLANRRYFFRRFDEEFARALRYGRSLCIIMIDIDHFKLVNDFYGHQVGDQALQLLADHLRGNCRVSDLVARYGGEEFVILLPEIDRTGAQVLAEKLRSVVAAATVRLNSQQMVDKPASEALIPESARFDQATLRFTISLGVACLDAAQLKELQPPSRLVALADAALYKAKHTGRNRVMVH